MLRRFAILITLGTLASPWAVVAQDFRQGAPKELPAQEAPKIEAADEAAVSETDESPVAVNMVRGLVFLPSKFHLDEKRDAGAGEGVTVVPRAPDEPGIDLDPLRDRDFRAVAAEILGKPATLADLDRFAYQVVRYYRMQGRPLVDVRVPEQDVTDGIVRFVVTEFKVDTVVVRGVEVTPQGRVVLTEKPRYFNAKHIRRGLRMTRDSRIDERRVVEDLNWLSANPFRRVDLIYRKSDEASYTDITMRVTERRPFRVYGGFENTGTPNTQRERWSAGFNWGNVFDWDHQFSYQYTASQDLFEDRPAGKDVSFQSHSFTYVAPLDTGFLDLHDQLLFFGTYQRSSPNIGPFFGLTGKSWLLSTRYGVQLPGGVQAKQQLSIGHDFKRTNNNLLFGGTAISNASTDVQQGAIEYSGSRTWRIGGTVQDIGLADDEGEGVIVTLAVGNSTFFSPGGIGRRNTDTAFQPSPTQSGTPFAEASYIYNRFTLAPSVRWPSGFEARLRANWQIASGNLLPSEQLSAAGPGFVRAYDPNAVIGSRGVQATQEFWAPSIPLFSEAGPMADRLRFGAFFDWARVGDEERLAGADKWTTTASTGLILTYNLGVNLSARLDYGWQLKKLPGATDRGSLGFIQITLGY
ncbi:MAG: ShlB/FhaC/HecB family hemolysin secretion/activation protein [Alphaproteobacteria bacterium]|nr:ShlB/FhaC/HecB family hemolysin secretion/activation protein [Alphaproteobacteria bacterium]